MFSLFGWGWKIRRLRKRWDRLREKALKKKMPERSIILEKLDTVEQDLRILEERKINRFERARIAKAVEISLEEVKEMIKAKAVPKREMRTYRETAGSAVNEDAKI